MIVEKIDRYFLNFIVKLKIIRNGTHQHWAPPDKERKDSPPLL